MMRPPGVVYGPIPTSNHNQHARKALDVMLFMVLFLHQTTTLPCLSLCWYELFMVLFLHQTTTARDSPKLKLCCLWSYSYIKPQPNFQNPKSAPCCLWSYSYIKPQLLSNIPEECKVVYGPIPTSNHNREGCLEI